MSLLSCLVRPCLALVLLVALLLPTPAQAAEGVEPEDLPVLEILNILRELPPPPVPALREPSLTDVEWKELGPAVAVALGHGVRLSAQSIFAQGPDDGLEVLLCLQGGKNHEALAWAQTGDARLVKAAFILALEVEDGQYTEEESGLPARGTPIRVLARWQPDPFLQPDTWVEVDASQLVRNRGTDQAFPALPYVYTGSRIRVVPMTSPDGELQRQERFMLEDTKSIAVNYDEGDALLASPFPIAARDLLFEVNSALAPLSRTPMEFIFTHAALPLTLHADAAGVLAADADGAALDDAALAELLAEHYGRDTQPEFSAVAIRIPATAERSVDAALRLRLLAAARQAEAWVVPIFIPVTLP